MTLTHAKALADANYDENLVALAIDFLHEKGYHQADFMDRMWRRGIMEAEREMRLALMIAVLQFIPVSND